MSLSPEQASIIKATVPVLQEHGETITRLFYSNMLDAHPELKSIFNLVNQVNHHQPRALAGALYAYAANINDLGVLSPVVELIAAKHASLYIQPEHYAIVGEHLLAAMKTVLGDALTDEIHDAWAAAYWMLANVFIGREAELYRQAGDWTTWREFRIARKERESSEIISFYLEPVDGKPLPSFLPGQFISVQINAPGLDHTQARQYSLSDAPNSTYYRISVKRERGLNPADPRAVGHPGLVSNVLHDQLAVGDVIRVSHPYGDFFFDPENTAPETSPIVLLGAGVGLTCLTSILNTVVNKQQQQQKSVPRHPISWIHVARSSDARAFGKHIQDTVKQNDNVHAVFFTDKPSKYDVLGVDYHHEGRFRLDRVSKDRDLFIGVEGAEYFVCGPTQFMLDMRKGLLELGVPADKIHVELFGTGGVPAA